jgi:hypothetical protein
MHYGLLIFVWFTGALIGAVLLTCAYQFFTRRSDLVKAFLVSFFVCLSLLAAVWRIGDIP